MVQRIDFPSMTGVRTYEQGRRIRFATDIKRLDEAKDARELSRAWAALEARGWWSKEERADVADSVLTRLSLFAHEDQ